MPDTRGRPLPSEILPVLKDPSITGWLRNFIINLGSAASIGRVPGFESAQNDQYVYPDNADANFAYNFDYVIPSNFQRLVSAKLSFKIRAFRSYNQFSATATGTESATHTHAQGNGGTSTDSTPIGNSNFVAVVKLSGNVLGNDSGLTANVVTNGHNHAQGTSGTESATHTHTVSTSSVLGIFEDVAPNNPGITVKVDGTDVTSKVGGPFQVDQVEIDVTQVLKTGVKAWHALALQPNQRVRITGILRISYYIDSRLAQ